MCLLFRCSSALVFNTVLVPPVINDLNTISDTCSFYIYACVIIFYLLKIYLFLTTVKQEPVIWVFPRDRKDRCGWTMSGESVREMVGLAEVLEVLAFL